MATQQRTDLDIEFFRKRLMEEKTAAEQAIQGTRASEDDGTGTMGMEANELSISDENHPGDTGTELFMREQDMALEQNSHDLLNRIERALAKIEEGTYGLSDRSHQPIPKERLEAVPYATLTVEEQDIQEIS